MIARPIRHLLTRLRADQRGLAAIELAIIAPMLVLLLVATEELGFAVRQQMQVQDAAAAGALYATEYGWDQAGIASAVTTAKSSSGIAATPTPVLFCGCPSVTGVSTATCGATCADGSTARQYVQVSASLTRTTLLPSQLPLPTTLTATATTRLP